MEEKYIQDLYNELGGQEKFGSFEDFKTLITTDENYQKDFYDSFGESTLGKFNDFTSLVSINNEQQPTEPVKKKGDTTVLPSEDGSLESQEVVFSEPKPQPQQLPASNQIETPDVVPEKETQEKKEVFKTGADKRIQEALDVITTDLISDTEENVVNDLSNNQTLKDLGFKFEESGWTGDYMTVLAPDDITEIEISLDNFLDSKSSKQSLILKEFIEKNIPDEKRKYLEKIVNLEEQDEAKYQSESKKLGDIFDRQLGIDPIEKDSDYLNKKLDNISADFINKTEEYVVPELQYQFGDLGFKFEESGAFGDYVKVTSPNNDKTIEIPLDNITGSRNKIEARELRDFIKENKPNKGLFILENTNRLQDIKFSSEKEVKDSIKSVSNELNNLNEKQKKYLLKKSEFEKKVSELRATPRDSDSSPIYSELEKEQENLKTELKSLLKEEDDIRFKGRKLDSAIGKYSIMKSKQGDYTGAVQDAFAKFPGTMASFASGLITDFMGSFAPISKTEGGMNFLPPLMSNEDATKLAFEAAEKLGFNPPKDGSQESINKFKASLTEDQLDDIESYVRDQVKKTKKKELLPLMRSGSLDLLGDPETTAEFSEEVKKGFYGAAFLGLAESAPAMMGGPIQRGIQMIAQISDGIDQEMEGNENFKDISENEKLALKIPIAIVGSVLENVGLKNIKGSTGVINSIAIRALGKANKGVSAKTFRELVENEVDNMLAKGFLTISAAGAAEFETGALQEISETGLKEIYNMTKSKEMFDTPDSFYDLVENVTVSGAQEAIGGFVLGVPTSVSVAFTEKGFLKMEDSTFEMFASMANDEQIQSAYVSKLKEKITTGELTVKQAKDQLNNYRNSVGLFKQLPDGLSTRQKKEAMNLLKEKKDLDGFIQGKDAALVSKQKARINAINQTLTELSQQPSTEYIIDEKQYTKEEFISQLEGKTQEELNAMNIVVNNDQETSNIVTEKFKIDAIQEQTTGQVPVQSETTVSETLAEEIPEAGTEVVTETQEEVINPLQDVKTTTTALEQLTPEQKGQELIEGIVIEGNELSIAEAYQQANQDGSNPDLVQAVENLLTPPQTIIEEQVSLKTQPEIVETVETETEGPVQKVTESGTTAFNEGVESVQQTAKEYRDKIAEEERQKQRSYQPGRVNPPALNLFERVSKMMADAYQSIKNEPTKAEVKKSYDALVSETKEQYEFIKDKGLKVIKHEGVGEPYANSKEMLRDIRENNTLKFLPNDVAFGEGDVDVSDNIGLQSSGIKLEDGYELTNSEVFRIVHDYFGHGILGNQFGAIGEENATLQHLDLYSDEAAPAVIFQTRGQNSWVNFSGANKEANDLRKQARELRKQGKTKEANELVEKANKVFKFAEPKIAIFPTKFNFKRYETARRINEQETIDSRPKKGANVLSKLLEKYSKKSSGTRGINKKSVRGIKRLGTLDLNVIAEYTLDNKISEGIKKAFPKFKGVQKIYEVTDGDVYRKMMEESLKDNPFSASVTVHSAEKFNGMRMFVTEDGSTGITLTKEGFLGGAFSNPNANRPQNLAQLMILGIREGATTAEAFDTILPDYYSEFGFKAVSRTAFNEEFKPMIKNGDAVRDWDFETYKRFNNGRPDVVFFIYDGGNRNTIEDRLGLFDLYENYEKENTESFDKDGYEQAEEVMKQQAVKRLEFELGIESQGLNEQDLQGYDRMMGEVEGIIEKSKKRRVSNAKITDNVMSYVMGSKVYENATDVQREVLVREVRKRFGLKEKSAPSVARLFGKIKDVKKITMTEKTALKKQIKDLARGAKDAVKAQKLAYQQLSKDIKDLKKSGKITSSQGANVLSAFSRVNVLSGKSVDRFTTYMTKVFDKADYADKIKKAKKLRSVIKKLSKNKDKNANLRVAASEFSKIDPALVDDIESYNEIASKIKEAVRGSSARLQKVKFAETINIPDVTDYTSKILKEQEQKVREEMIAELQELMEVDASEFSAEDMLSILGPKEVAPKKTTKYNEGIIRATVKRAFDVYSSVIKKYINTGKDIFTDEDVDYTDSQKEIIKKFMEMDTDEMNIKDSLAAVDSLMNFLTNRSTSKMEAVIAKYTGQQNAKKIVNENIFAVPLSKLGSRNFGRFLGEQTTNLNVLFEKMFVGFNRATKVMDAIGLTDIINGKSKAQIQANIIADNYVDKFYNKKANNQKFNTVYNNIERGMVSFVRRNIIGTEAEMKAEFDRRKNLIKESIEVLSNGNEQEINKGLVYQEVYDKIIKDSDDIQSIESKVDPNNLEAINWWAQEWDAKFEKLSDTALNIYNKVLDKDLNYSSPDRFTRISYDGGSVDLANTASAFITNTNGNLYKKETGVLMEATRPRSLPRNEDSNLVESYIDLSFDKNNSNSMYDALVDINTAAPIRQAEAFMNTAEFKKIFGVDADLIKGNASNTGRIQQYIQNIRNKNPYSNDEFAKAMKSLNKIATLGVGQALAGPTQPLKQVVPVVFNTLINAQGNVDFSAMSNPDFMSWLKESGYAIASRGVESQADIESINRIVSQAAESKGEKAIALLESANKKWLNILLVKPDVWIATASWKSYYEQSLKKQGVDSKNLDYKTHQINKKAANYAQRMVDRQQNVSDTDMAGTMFSNRNPYAQTMVKIFMPFASFRMNQASRLGADLRTLSKWKISTVEDRQIAARSLAGYAVEMAVFRVLSMGLAIAISSLTASLMGKEDDEEEKEKRRDNLIKGAVTSILIDIVSPIPVFDKLVQNNAAFLLENIQKALGAEDKDIKNIYTSRKANFVDALGTFGIAAKRIDEVWDLISLASTGTYENDFGKTIEIDSNNQEALMKIAPVVLLSIITGFASPEISSIGRNAARMAKKKDTTFEELKRQRAKNLLGGYKNKTDLKRYDPKLYEKNFGKGSEWYESTKEEREAKLKEAKEEREMKDKMYNYTKKGGFGSKKFGAKWSSKKGSGSFGSKKFGGN